MIVLMLFQNMKIANALLNNVLYKTKGELDHATTNGLEMVGI